MMVQVHPTRYLSNNAGSPKNAIEGYERTVLVPYYSTVLTVDYLGYLQCVNTISLNSIPDCTIP